MKKHEYQYNVVTKSEICKENPSWNIFFRQLLVSTGALCINFCVGLFFGAPAIVVQQLRDEARSADVVSVHTASWLSSILGYGSLPWILILATLTHVYGRKKTYILVSAINIVTFVCFYLSVTTTHLLLIAIGQSCPLAAAFTVNILVLTEFTSPKYRGIFLTMKAASLLWGVWCSNAIGTFFHWKMIPLFGLVCSAYPLTCLAWPESPYWLASKGKIEQCKRSHRWLKGTSVEAERELKKLTEEKMEPFRIGSIRDIGKKQFYKPILICSLMVLQFYSSGKFVCTVYSIEILKQVTSSSEAAYSTMLILDGVSVLSAYVGCLLNGFVKRRTQLFTTSLISVVLLLTLSLYLYLIKLDVIVANNVLSVLILMLFLVTVSCGPAVMAPSSLGEFIPSKYKTLCVILVSLWFQALNSTVLKLFPYIHMQCGLHGTFLCYGVVMASVSAILFCIMPETKGKTLYQIEEYFK